MSNRWRRNRFQASRRTGTFRLRIEPLEARRLLAGIQVSVYIDQDNSRSFDPATDAAAPNRLVYVDLNTNGTREPNEPVAVTDEAGNAFFADLGIGDYSIGLITNPFTQPQTEPTRIAEPQPLSNYTAGKSFLASSDLGTVWSVDSEGYAHPIPRPPADARVDLPESVALGHVLVGTQTEQSHYLAITDGEFVREFLDFDLKTGEMSRLPLNGTPADATFQSISRTSEQTIALLRSPAGNLLAQISPQVIRAQINNPVFTPAYAIASSANSPLVAALSSTSSGQTKLALLNPQMGFAETASLTFDESASNVTFSSDGKFTYVSLSAGGILAFALTPSSLSLAAILHEAAGHVAASSTDARIVTGSIRSPREVITWDTATWLPLGRTQLPTGSNPFVLPTFAIDSVGDNVLALAGNQLVAVALSAPVPLQTSLTESNQVSHLRVGVRPTGTNTAPQVSGPVTRQIAEDSSDRFELLETNVFDTDADTLWFSLASPANHGTLELAEDGLWSYIPNPDFSGEDSAVFLVHDGQNSSELLLSWQVSAVDDLPTSISVGEFLLPEDAEPGTAVGAVTVVDPDQDSSYQITTADDRFEVIDGILTYVGGELDFETEPLITITLTALDLHNSSVFVSAQATIQVVDVNEEPNLIRLNGNSVPENEPGASIGTVSIVDQDSNANFEFYLFDSRFTIENQQLKLSEGVALDFEAEPVIDLIIAATDGIYEIAEIVTIHVLDRLDGASVIQLNGRTLDESTAGAVVGPLLVLNPQNGSYHFSVSDPRFEVVGSVLKLRDDEQISAQTEPTVTLTATATGDEGDSAAGTFTITLIASPSPYHNLLNPGDVNGDGVVSAMDVLLIINLLNTHGTYPLPTGGLGTGESPSEMPDVNDDGLVSPIDVLLIINQINGNSDDSFSSSREPMRPEGESPESIGAVSLITYDVEAERRKRENSHIDAELETLLDQLSRAQRK